MLRYLLDILFLLRITSRPKIWIMELDWGKKKVTISSATQGRLQKYNVLPWAFIVFNQFLAVRLHCSEYFVEPILGNIRKCTVDASGKQIGDQTWDVTLFELKKFIGLVRDAGTSVGQGGGRKKLKAVETYEKQKIITNY